MYEAFEVKRYFTAFFTFFIPVSLFDSEIPLLRPDPHVLEVARQGLSRPAAALR